MDSFTLIALHQWLSEIFAVGTPGDMADALDMLSIFEQWEKRSLWNYLGYHDAQLRQQMKAIRSTGSKTVQPMELA